MTKTPGILLFPAYILVIAESYVIPKFIVSEAEGKVGIHEFKWNWKFLYLFLIPLGLLAVFGLLVISSMVTSGKLNLPRRSGN